MNVLKTCRTCKHLKVNPDADGKRRPRKNFSYVCNAEVPDIETITAILKLPKSVCLSFRATWGATEWPPLRRRMEPDEGEGCLRWEKKS